MDREQALINLRDKVKAGGVSINFMDGAMDFSLWCWVSESFFGSMDAALSLHNAVLPGWAWSIYEEDNGEFRAMIGDRSDVKIYQESWAETPARAWLIAILNALIAQEASKTPHRENG